MERRLDKEGNKMDGQTEIKLDRMCLVILCCTSEVTVTSSIFINDAILNIGSFTEQNALQIVSGNLHKIHI